MKTIWRGAVLAGAAGLIALSSTAAASATTAPRTPAVKAVTKLTDRNLASNDSTWITENVTRVLTVALEGETETGTTITSYQYLATVKDSGSFTTFKGALTPNQAGKYKGRKIVARVNGTVADTEMFRFSTSKPVSTAANLGVIKSEKGAFPMRGDLNWFQQAFPAGTAFGATTGSFSWTYTYQPPTKPHTKKPAAQKWTYSSTNGYGEKVADGNITG